MESMDQEIEAEVFVWETSAETVVETVEESSEVTATTLRSTALEALDGLEETAPAEVNETSTAPSLALNIEVDGLTADTAPVFVAASADTQTADVASTPVLEVAAEEAAASDALDISDAEYAASCMALLNEKYPNGISELFGNGVAEGLFALVWGKGLISGNEEWTNADQMLIDAVFMTLEDAGIDLGELWEDFTSDLVNKLFPNGFSTENLPTALAQNGPISGEAEWTELDFQAFDLVKSLVWEDTFDGNWQDYLLEIFNDLYPGGIAELFPDGYSDEAFDALMDGKGLYSGEADWTDEDCMLFEGLWQALLASGIEPFEGDQDFAPLPIVIDDGIAYPMPEVIDDGFVYPMPEVIDDGIAYPMPEVINDGPIVIDDGVYPMPIVIDDGAGFGGQPENPIMVICDFLPPEMVVCTFVNEDMISI